MEIIYAGDSHYGAGALRSIQKYFDKVYLPVRNPQDILNEKRPEDQIIEDFDDSDCGIVFLGGYPDFITQKQLETKTYVNVHGALLPKYRGMHSVFWAIMNGEKQLGITFHLVNAYMDAGDILAQYAFDYEGQSVASILASVDELVERHAGEVLYDYVQGRIQPVPQDESAATYGARRNLADCRIEFEWPNERLRRFFLALTPPYPYPMLCIRGEWYETLDYQIVDRAYFGPVGRAVYVDHQGVWIKTGEGFLIVSKVRKTGGGYEEVELKELVRIGYRFDKRV